MVLGLSFIIYQPACAYETDTHGLLTQEAVRLYNQHNMDFSGATWAPFLIDGARREDDAPRWMNHFYDPVKNRGLSQDLAIDPFYRLGNWESSKAWAQDALNQNKLTYSPVIASVLSLIETGKIQKFIPTSDFTWQQAQKYWIQGDKEMALFTLGHIMHLIQDAAVPDHTRNDSHAEGSPYEKFAGQYTTQNPDRALSKRLQNIPIEQNYSLADYFNNIALYSNNNFYSKDTIGIQSGYDLPQPDYFRKEGKFYYGFKRMDGEDIHLLAKITPAIFTYMDSENATTLNEDDRSNRINGDYWSLLSKKAVQYSAGVVDLFMKEVELHKNDPAYTTKEKPSFLAQVASFAKNTVSSVQQTISSIFGGGNYSFSQIQEIPISQNSSQINTPENTPQQIIKTPVDSEVKNPTPPDPIQQNKTSDQKISPQITTTTPQQEPIIKPEEISLTKTTKEKAENINTPTCAIPLYKNPTNGPLIFNELAWMGTTRSGNNEWMELKNIDSYPVSIAGWTLRNKSKSIDISLADSKTKNIASKDFFLLERTDNTSAPAASNLVYTGALKNTDEELYLFDSFCNLIDYMSAQPTWRAGDADEHRTMERDVGGYGWHTSSLINGTPKKENSAPYITPQKETVTKKATTTTKTTTTQTTHTSTNTSQGSQTQHVVYTPPPPHTISINEIMYNPSGNDTDREWIEIRNNASTTITLDSPPWKLREEETNHTISPYRGGTSITSGGYAILAQDGQKFLTDYPSINVPLFTSSFSLNNDGESLSLIYDTTAIDTETYASTTGAYGDGNSLQYIENTWKASTPTPGDINVFSLQSSTQNETTTQATPTQETSTSTEATSKEATSTPQEEPTGAQEANHLVISEIYPDKTGANEDFIELYNPTQYPISLASYAVRIRDENATESASLIDFGGESKLTVYAHGFYLVGLDNYAENGLHAADAHRGASLPSTQPATIFIQHAQEDSTEIIDSITYNPDELQNNQSFERKAYAESACYAAQETHELEGNACDTDQATDITVRTIKNQQNTLSLLEPRLRPQQIQDLASTYNKNTVQVQLAWNDTTNAPGTIYYNIYEINPDTSRTWYASTTASTSSVRIETLAKEYTFTVVATDAEGYESTDITTRVTIPSFISDVHFYNASDPTIELYYDSYPFIPSLHPDYTGDMGGRLVVPYLNSGPYYERYVEGSPSATNSRWSAEALNNIYPLRYKSVWGSDTYKELYLRDTSRFISSGSLSFDSIGNNKLTVGTWMDRVPPPPTFDTNSYITFAFYDQSYDNTQFKTYSLVAVDPTKYYLTPDIPQ